MNLRSLLFVFLIIVLSACVSTASEDTSGDSNGVLAGANAEDEPLVSIAVEELPIEITAPTSTQPPALIDIQETPLPTIRPTLSPEGWEYLPVIPVISQRAREIYLRGLDMGNRPNSFIKIGDCDATPTWFLGDFDQGPHLYSLGEYTELQQTIDYFKGSFGRDSVAVRRGFNSASVLSPIWANSAECNKNETPLDCEVRIQNPSIALLLIGTNDTHNPEQFEPNLRKILDRLIERGILPILSTKADNREVDHRINQVIVQLAHEYDIPLWNFWLAIQPLPSHGLQEDGVHLTFAANHFNDPVRMKAAWPWRNLTALQVLDVVRRELNKP